MRGALAAWERTIAAERALLATLGGAPSRQLDRLFLDEIAASTALGGAKLSPAEVEALVERGVVIGPQPLESCLAVADYAEAVRFLRQAPLPRGRLPFLRLEEVVGLHARALRRSAGGEPGTWRSVNVGPLPGGIVPPGPSLVPRQMLALVDRLAAGPPAGQPVLLWVATAHQRIARIHPFLRGSGRTCRLVANLLLRRLDLPPAAFRGRLAEGYLRTLRQAGSPDATPLALLLGRVVLAALNRLCARPGAGVELQPIGSLAGGAEKDALYKAAQRGRLRVVRLQGALWTTPGWIAEYRASRRSRATET